MEIIVTQKGQPQTGYSNHPLYENFRNMVHRGENVGCDFSFGQEDFNRWLEVIGPIPKNMERPTVGRYDHSKGYIFDSENNRWNFRWQEALENFGDGAKTQLKNGTHFSQSELFSFYMRNAQRAATASPNAPYKNGRAGFQTGAATRASIASPNHPSKTGKSGFQTKSTCPYCGKVGMTTNMKRWHFDNCKSRSTM